MIYRYITALVFAALVALGSGQAIAAATILPPPETCFSALAPTSGGSGNTGTGFIGLLGTITGGSGGTSGTYGGVALTGGSGTGATANITVSGGVVTAVAILNPGSQYVVGDVLSAASGNIGNVSGFSVPVSSVAINSSLAGGKVYTYIPNTQTNKQTWFNTDQAANHLNTNPVTLDANGCAIIIGTGSYRFIVQDSLGNTVYDQTTTDTSASNSVFWAGQAGGTPNAITVTDAGFNGTDGSVINFMALANNTGATTLNPSGYGAINIVKDTASGPVALTGGEIDAINSGSANVISVVYSASQNNFHILNLISSAASTSQAPLCGAINLKITNDGTFPSSKVNITADQVVMLTTGGAYITRSNVSTSVNFTTGTTTSTAGGLDGEAFSASTWFNLYLIDNGVAPNGLASTSATAPTMPSGYSYRCRLGVTRTDGSSNLLRLLQRGSLAHYVVTTGTNTANYPVMASGSTTGNISVANYAPPTAEGINVILSGSAGAGAVGAYVSANSATSSQGAYTNTPELGFQFASGSSGEYSAKALITLEGTTVYFSNSGAGASQTGIAAEGWKDAVNAN
jgi:hypothetical protein